MVSIPSSAPDGSARSLTSRSRGERGAENGSAPLVTIGMPVYNGASHFREALESLLAQDYPHVEILISDNASTDETSAIAKQYAASHSFIRYSRNPENVGPHRNFLKVADEARGKYFFWAAHDDQWRPGYISRLVEQLEADPEAVLATPLSVFIENDGSPTKRYRPQRPASGRSLLSNYQELLQDNASCWIYGIYRTDWLQQNVRTLLEYPKFSADLRWLARDSLQRQYVGSPEAVLVKRLPPGMYIYSLQSRLEELHYCVVMLASLAKTSLTARLSWPRRIVALGSGWSFMFSFIGGACLRILGRLVGIKASITHRQNDVPAPPATGSGGTEPASRTLNPASAPSKAA